MNLKDAEIKIGIDKDKKMFAIVSIPIKDKGNSMFLLKEYKHWFEKGD